MCTPKKKAVKTKTAKKVSVNGKAVRAAGPTTTVRPEPRPNTASFETLQARNTAYQQQQANKAKRKKKAKQAAARETATSTTPTTTTTTTPTTPTTTTTTPTTTTTTAPVGTIGTSVGNTSVTPESIYTQDPEKAMEAQELLAQDELKRQRIKRARAKQSLLRRRVERDREVGSGRRVLSGSEKELNVQSRQAGTGRRGGAGRRSLITGSTGGIGYYSRFL
tara:strand:- start:3472 stop:4134 length:663 start_codon:yes stop_codon:yes gene_type:complete